MNYTIIIIRSDLGVHYINDISIMPYMTIKWKGCVLLVVIGDNGKF